MKKVEFIYWTNAEKRQGVLVYLPRVKAIIYYLLGRGVIVKKCDKKYLDKS